MSTNHTLPVGTVVNYTGSARHGRYVIIKVQERPFDDDRPGTVRYAIESIVAEGTYAFARSLDGDHRRYPVGLGNVHPCSLRPIWRDGGFVTIDPQDRF